MSQTSFQNLQELLEKKGVSYRVITHRPVFTMSDVIRELDIPKQAMAKALLMDVRSKGLFRVVLPGTDRLNIKQLASIIGVPRKSIHFAHKDVIEQSGFTVGAIPPFGGGLPTYIDKSLLKQEVVYCGAGDNDKTFSLEPHDLVALSSAITADISTSTDE